MKNLDTLDYAENLCHYLDHSWGATELSMGDQRNVLNRLNNSPTALDDVSVNSTVIDQIDQWCVEVEKVISEKTTENEVNHHYGEHLGCMMTDDVGYKINWHLRVVHKCENGELCHT